MSGSTPRAEIAVRRCTVTVVRRGGWSWGPEPRGLAGRVVDALPDLLAERFGEHLTGDGPDVEITEPVTVTVRLEAGRSPGTADVPLIGPVQVPGPDAVSFEESFLEPVPRPVPSAGTLFGELAERGELGPLLALLPEDSVRAFLLALLTGDTAEPGPPGVVERVFAELAARAGPARLARSLPGSLRGLVPAARSPGPASDEALTSLAGMLPRLLSHLGREGVARLVDALREPPPDGETAREDRAVDRGTAARAAGEFQVWSALPFLLAGPLARVGYLDAIGPALAGLDLAGDAPLFAAALAYKVLGVTGPGRRRAERDRVAAAVFAGLEPPVPDEDLAGMARRLRPALPVLDGVLALSLARGHDPAEPLLITGAAGRMLLVDAQGMFPIAWAGEVAGLLPHWRACGRPPVLVCDGPVPAGCLCELAEAGVRFLSTVRPLRGDPVTRLPWRFPLWASEGAALEPRLAAELPAQAGRLGELVRAMAVERLAVPSAREGDLERCVTLAAGLGLGTIAWMLWRDREAPDPVLALTRFADLEATVRFEPAAVRVRVPLGRRHADLLRSGLLADVPDVVWLGGRTLTFSGG